MCLESDGWYPTFPIARRRTSDYNFRLHKRANVLEVSGKMGSLINEIRQCLHPHYISNLILAVLFFFVKTVAPFCHMLFEDCELEIVSFFYYRSISDNVVLRFSVRRFCFLALLPLSD